MVLDNNNLIHILRVCDNQEKSKNWIVDNEIVEKFLNVFDEYKAKFIRKIRKELTMLRSIFYSI